MCLVVLRRIDGCVVEQPSLEFWPVIDEQTEMGVKIEANFYFDSSDRAVPSERTSEKSQTRAYRASSSDTVSKPIR